MVSKAKIKYLKSLQVKKYRKQEQSFVVEGAKSVQELLGSSFDVTWVGGTKDFLQTHARQLASRKIEVAEVSAKELEQLGSFQTNETVMAVAKMKQNSLPDLKDEFVLLLDDLRDPGNVGTIIRTADWYGIKNIIASDETADFYNPKTISATMGSFCRVNVFYTNLSEFFRQNKLPVFGAFMDGANVHQLDFGKSGLIVIGNESNGISEEVSQFVQQRITIPKIGGAESLNAGIATGIILDNIFRLKK
ncbi:MAG TPA: RNA methyltransferase [Cyclobacteriaceae bacterium]|nr:RNA methyltransferase [Cyclobacteriaceae bacterium]